MKTIILFLIPLIFALSCKKTPEISELQADKFLKYFGTSGADVAGDIITVDGGYLMLGSEWSTKGQNAVLYKTDRFGNMEWKKKLDTTGHYTAKAFVQSADGWLYVCGSTLDEFGYHDIFITKISPEYKVYSSKIFGGPLDEIANDIELDDAGNLYLTGTRYTDAKRNEDNTDIFIMKASAAGDSLWSKNIGGSRAESGNAIGIHPDGKLFVLGSSTSFNEAGQDKSNIILITTNMNGNLLDRANYGAMGNDYGFGIAITDGGTVYLSGAVENESNDTDAWIARIDGDIHAPAWEKTTGFSRDDYLYSVKESNGTLLAAGFTRDETLGDKNAYILQFSSDGTETNRFVPDGEGEELAQAVAFGLDDNPVVVGVSEYESNAMLFIQKTKF